MDRYAQTKLFRQIMIEREGNRDRQTEREGTERERERGDREGGEDRESRVHEYGFRDSGAKHINLQLYEFMAWL